MVEPVPYSPCPTTLVLVPWAGKVLIVQRLIIVPATLVDKMVCASRPDIPFGANASTASTGLTAESTLMSVIEILAAMEAHAGILTDRISKC